MAGLLEIRDCSPRIAVLSGHGLICEAIMTKSPIVGYIRRGFKPRQKVIGLGYMKTGTTTLGRCLKYYGLRHVSHRRDLLLKYADGDVDAMLDESERFDSFEDIPWPLAFRELYGKYGDGAKYILTTRDTSERWVESLKKHSLRKKAVFPLPRGILFGVDFPHGEEDRCISIYEKHNADVREFFSDKPDVFLDICWEKGHGWPELSAFLGYPTPRIPLPHANAADNHVVDPAIEAENKALLAAHLAALQSRKSAQM